MARIIILKADFEKLGAGENLRSIQIFKNLSECPQYTRDDPNAWLIEVRLVSVHSDIRLSFRKGG